MKNELHKKLMDELNGFQLLIIKGIIPIGFSTKCNRRVSNSILKKIIRFYE